MRKNTLLEEYVREALLLEYTEDAMGYGLTGADMKDIFVTPFKNAFGAVRGEVGKLGTTLFTGVKVAFQAIVTTIVPFLSADYKKIWANHNAKIQQTNSKYAKYYEGVQHALSNSDFVAAAFVYHPAAFFTAPLITAAPRAFIASAEGMSGGSQTIGQFLSKVKREYGYDKRSRAVTRRREGDYFAEGKINEGSEKSIGDVLSQKKFVDALTATPVAQQMMRDGQAAVNSMLDDVYKRAQGLSKSKTIADIESATKKQFQKAHEQLDKLPQDQRAAVESKMVAEIVSGVRDMYAVPLEKHIEQAVNDGVPSSSPYIAAYKKTAAKIRGL